MRVLRWISALALWTALAAAATQDPTPETEPEYTAAAAVQMEPEYKDYDEQLLLKTLPGNSVLASFRFTTNGTFSAHHSLFPRSLAQILTHASTRELHLKFTLGRWNAERWGAQIHNGTSGGGTGVELWAWVEAATDAAADARWTTLTNALSGLFCASLNFIDSTRTIRPVTSFAPSPHHARPVRLHLLHGSLPREPVCTENLTPFLKLLPCSGKAGISSLLSGHRLFDAQWQSMSIDVSPRPDGAGVQVVQTVAMVLDIERSLARRHSPVPLPVPVDELRCDESKWYANADTCFPRAAASALPWSLAELFGRPLAGFCPLAQGRTHVCADVPAARPVFITPGAAETKTPAGARCFTLPEQAEAPFDLIVPESDAADTPFPAPPLYASRSFTGHGQEHGGVQAVLTNPSTSAAVEFVYLESLPWFMKPYLHTLRIALDPPDAAWPQPRLLRGLYYRPPLDRKRGTHLEAALRIPANSTLVLTYEFEKAVLRYTEYPPDANRGFDIAPAVITGGAGTWSVRTTSLLLSLPTPDFSMPYNVIILSSTVMAMAFGGVFNPLVRRFVGASEVRGRGRGERIKAGVARVVGGVRAAVGRWREGKRKAE